MVAPVTGCCPPCTMPVAFTAAAAEVALFVGPCKAHPPRPARERDRERHTRDEGSLRIMVHSNQRTAVAGLSCWKTMSKPLGLLRLAATDIPDAAGGGRLAQGD